MFQRIPLAQPLLIPSEKPAGIGNSFNLVQIQGFQIICNGVINSPVYIESIKSLG